MDLHSMRDDIDFWGRVLSVIFLRIASPVPLRQRRPFRGTAPGMAAK
jgi:hypothetical protein